MSLFPGYSSFSGRRPRFDQPSEVRIESVYTVGAFGRQDCVHKKVYAIHEHVDGRKERVSTVRRRRSAGARLASRPYGSRLASSAVSLLPTATSSPPLPPLQAPSCSRLERPAVLKASLPPSCYRAVNKRCHGRHQTRKLGSTQTSIIFFSRD